MAEYQLAFLGAAIGAALYFLNRIDRGIRDLIAEVKQMKIDLIHERRGVL